MIIVRFMGGLGNQLFCYAFSTYMAQLYPGRKVIVDNRYGYISDQFSRFPLLKSLSFSSNALFVDDLHLPSSELLVRLIRFFGFLCFLLKSGGRFDLARFSGLWELLTSSIGSESTEAPLSPQELSSDIGDISNCGADACAIVEFRSKDSLCL